MAMGDKGPHPRAVLMAPDDIISMKRAVHHARKSLDTIRRWCRRYGIARQATPGSPLEVSAIALEMVLHGDVEALELLREGRRSDPAVKRYIDHLGLHV
jgi:hypothetical protein